MILGISGKIGSGKDTVANIICSLDYWYNQYGKSLIENENFNDLLFVESILKNPDSNSIIQTSWTIKKFAAKLKEMCAILFDCDVKDFENIDFKNSVLPDVWQTYHGDGALTQITYRYALQRIGTELFRRHWNNNTWVISTLSGYKPLHKEYPKGNYSNVCRTCGKNIMWCAKLCNICKDCWEKHNYPNWIISDVRFLNEINSIKEHGGYVIKVERGEKTNSSHASETEMELYENWDYIIDNNYDFIPLIQQVKNIMIELNLLRLE